MKTLYVNGPSTCYGMDLRPRGSGIPLAEHRAKSCFAGVLGKRLGYSVVNNSFPASSNYSTMRRVMADLKIVKPDLIIIGISPITVKEIWDPERNSFINILQKEYYFPKTVLVPNETGAPSNYDTDYQRQEYLRYKKEANVEKDIATFEQDILKIQNDLDATGIKYLLFQVAPIIPNKIENGYTDVENDIKQFSKYFTDLSSINTDNWLGFDSFNVIEDKELKEVPKGKTGHILELGHKILADKLYDKIITSNLYV